MSQLSLHCKDKEYYPVEQENGPKDRDIKHRKECHYECNTYRFCQWVPANAVKIYEYKSILLQDHQSITEKQLNIILLILKFMDLTYIRCNSYLFPTQEWPPSFTLGSQIWLARCLHLYFKHHMPKDLSIWTVKGLSVWRHSSL